jgi:hypothetical protein
VVSGLAQVPQRILKIRCRGRELFVKLLHARPVIVKRLSVRFILWQHGPDELIEFLIPGALSIDAGIEVVLREVGHLSRAVVPEPRNLAIPPDRLKVYRGSLQV